MSVTWKECNNCPTHPQPHAHAFKSGRDVGFVLSTKSSARKQLEAFVHLGWISSTDRYAHLQTIDRLPIPAE